MMKKRFLRPSFLALRMFCLASACSLLSACLGGSIAQQIARSVLTKIADKSIARVLDVDEGQAQSNRKPDLSAAPKSKASKNLATNNTLPAAPELDKYTRAFMHAGFETVKPITEPLPENVNAETQLEVIQIKALVQVELFNLLIGSEKTAIFERARYIGAQGLPGMREWPYWQVATGAVLADNENERKLITFLIPPEFGKMASGSLAMVEIAGPGELSIVRYRGD